MNPFLYGQPVNTARFLWRVGDHYYGVPLFGFISGLLYQAIDFSGKKILIKGTL